MKKIILTQGIPASWKTTFAIVKQEMFKKYYNVIAVFDDRNKVVDMWRKLKLPTYQVWYGNF